MGGGLLLLPSQGQLRACNAHPPPSEGPARASASVGGAASGPSDTRLVGSGNKLPFIKTRLHNSHLCLRWQAGVEDPVMTQS